MITKGGHATYYLTSKVLIIIVYLESRFELTLRPKEKVPKNRDDFVCASGRIRPRIPAILFRFAYKIDSVSWTATRSVSLQSVARHILRGFES